MHRQERARHTTGRAQKRPHCCTPAGPHCCPARPGATKGGGGHQCSLKPPPGGLSSQTPDECNIGRISKNGPCLPTPGGVAGARGSGRFLITETGVMSGCPPQSWLAAFQGQNRTERGTLHLAGPGAAQRRWQILQPEEKAQDPARTSNKSSACRVYKARAQPSQGKALARPVTEHRARPINTTFLF